MSLAAAPIKEHFDTNIFSTERLDLFKGTVIYGANASGKSNFIRAMSTMRRLVLQSFDQSSKDELDVTSFLLSTEAENAPSFFETVFVIDNVRYRYGFEADDKRINNFITISGLTHEGYKGVTFGMLEDKKTNPKLLNFYKKLDLGFDDISINKMPFDPKGLPKDMSESIFRQLVTDLEGAFRIDIKTIHKKFNAKNRQDK